MPSTSPVAAGDTLGDRYVMRRIEWPTPLGPMWSARDRVLDRTVLVQILSGDLAAHPGARRAFQKAAARVAQVTHPGVLQVFDIGDDPPFVVFEHAEGGRLAERLGVGPLRPTEAARAALTLARALEALHERGTTHGSLSPELVLLGQEGRVKLLALGIDDTARALRVAPASRRAAPAIELAPHGEQPANYRPPEPEAEPAERDRFALAALTYHLFTGKPPVRGRTARMERRSVPQAIDDLLARALSAAPAERPTLDEFVAVLAPFGRVQPKEAREPRVSLSEFRWIVPVVVIVALAAAAATVGVGIVGDLAENLRPAPSPTARAPAGDRPLPVEAVTDFDPLGNREENPEHADEAADGDADTGWRTVCYGSARLGGKDGVGLLFDLGTVRQLRVTRVQTSLPGWTAEIRIANDAGEDPGNYRVVKSFTAELDQRIAMPSGSRGRYVLLWITQLTRDPDPCEYPFRAVVDEVAFFA